MVSGMSTNAAKGGRTGSSGSSGKKDSAASPLHGPPKGGITYTKVATEVDSDGDSEDETIEFNDLDITVREFNPFTFGGGADKA